MANLARLYVFAKYLIWKTPLWGFALSALYFVLYDLFSARRFVAKYALIVKFRNVDKQCIR